MAESLWSRIADLPLAIDSHALERLEARAQELAGGLEPTLAREGMVVELP
jgi:hypothetical protein